MLWGLGLSEPDIRASDGRHADAGAGEHGEPRMLKMKHLGRALDHEALLDRAAWLAANPTPPSDRWRKCEFCGCETNARLRACCEKGRDADSNRHSDPAETDTTARRNV